MIGWRSTKTAVFFDGKIRFDRIPRRQSRQMMASPLVIYPELTAVVAPMLFRAGGTTRPWRATVIDTRLALRQAQQGRAPLRYCRHAGAPYAYRAGEQAGDGARGATAGRHAGVGFCGRWWRCTHGSLNRPTGVRRISSIIFLNSRRFSRHAPLAEPEGVVDLCLRADAIVREILGIRPRFRATYLMQ